MLQAYCQFQEKLVCLWFNSESRQNIEIQFVCYIEVLWKNSNQKSKEKSGLQDIGTLKKKNLQDSLVMRDFMGFA